MQPLVSVVIVSMNNLGVLSDCLNSIRDHTSVEYEVICVTYLFSPENLSLLRERYPWVIVIESNEIRGFSENNNLALRQARGEFCFVINDDTFFDTPLIDGLVADFQALPDKVAVISPNIKYPDGRDQFCGRPKMHLLGETLRLFRIDTYRHSKYVDQKGLFRTYHLMGGAFMIKTDIFREMGFFDEYYFFCPEDVALSEQLNRSGYQCYVDSEQVIYHIASSSFSKTMTATMPASIRGLIVFFTKDRFLYRVFYSFAWILQLSLKMLASLVLWVFSPVQRANARIKLLACWRSLKVVFDNRSPKEIFMSYFNV